MSRIVLSKRLTTEIDPEGPDAKHRLRVWISETTNNIPAALFVYQRIPRVPKTTEKQLESLFVHVASYADILDFPAGEPNDESPFFRQYFFDVTFDSLSMLDDKWTMMKSMINATISDIVSLNNLPAVSLEEFDAGP